MFPPTRRMWTAPTFALAVSAPCAKRATFPKSLATVLVSPPVAEAIRKELWRETKQRVDTEEIVRLLKETVIREDCL